VQQTVNQNVSDQAMPTQRNIYKGTVYVHRERDRYRDEYVNKTSWHSESWPRHVQPSNKSSILYDSLHPTKHNNATFAGSPRMWMPDSCVKLATRTWPKTARETYDVPLKYGRYVFPLTAGGARPASAPHVPQRRSTGAADIQLERGDALYRAGKFRGAMNEYTKGITANPTAKLYARRCVTNVQQGDFEAALQDAIFSMKLDSNDPKGRLRLKSLQDYIKKFKSADSGWDTCHQSLLANIMPRDLKGRQRPQTARTFRD